MTLYSQVAVSKSLSLSKVHLSTVLPGKTCCFACPHIFSGQLRFYPDTCHKSQETIWCPTVTLYTVKVGVALLSQAKITSSPKALLREFSKTNMVDRLEIVEKILLCVLCRLKQFV